MHTCTADDLKMALAEKKEGVFFVDVRTLGEYQRGHIEGFVNIPLDADLSHWQKIDKNAPVYLICLSGARSEKVGRFLETMGYQNLLNIQGGLLAWRAKGGLVVT
jgi:rhodanese-related sulfurtransferase